MGILSRGGGEWLVIWVQSGRGSSVRGAEGPASYVPSPSAALLGFRPRAKSDRQAGRGGPAVRRPPGPLSAP